MSFAFAEYLGSQSRCCLVRWLCSCFLQLRYLACLRFQPGVVYSYFIIMARQHSYTDIQLDEPHYDAASSSSTEVESLVGREKEWAAHNYQDGPSRSRRNVLCPPILAMLRWVLVIGLQFVIIGLLAKEQGLLMNSKWWRSGTTSANEVGGDITGWGPHRTSLSAHASSKDLTLYSPNPNHKIPHQPNFRPKQHI